MVRGILFLAMKAAGQDALVRSTEAWPARAHPPAPPVRLRRELPMQESHASSTPPLHDSPDAAIEAMDGQFLMNRTISVGYAFKKDTRGERHGTPAERLLAAQKKLQSKEVQRPHTRFATGALRDRLSVVGAAFPWASFGSGRRRAGVVHRQWRHQGDLQES